IHPRSLGLPPKAGADDFLEGGGTLEGAFLKLFGTPGGSQIESILRQTIVTPARSYIAPGTKTLRSITKDSAGHLWFAYTGQVPQPRIRDQLWHELERRADSSTVRVVWR